MGLSWRSWAVVAGGLWLWGGLALVGWVPWMPLHGVWLGFAIVWAVFSYRKARKEVAADASS